MGQVITSYDQIQRLVTGTTPAARKGIVRNEAGDGWEFAPLARTDKANTFSSSSGVTNFGEDVLGPSPNQIRVYGNHPSVTGWYGYLSADENGVYLGCTHNRTIQILPGGNGGVVLIGNDGTHCYCYGSVLDFKKPYYPTLNLLDDGTYYATSQSGTLIRLAQRSSTATAREQADIDTAWNDNTDATRSGDLILRAWYTTNAREVIRIRGGSSDGQLGFYGVTPISRAVLATGASHTVDDVITALQNLGLVKQS